MLNADLENVRALEVKLVLNVHVSTGEPAIAVARFLSQVEVQPAKPIEAAKPAPVAIPTPAPARVDEDPDADPPLEDDCQELEAKAASKLTVGRRPCGCALRGPHRRDGCAARRMEIVGP